MAKRSKNPPKDEEILSYDNVPLETAAKYIGWSSVTVCKLKDLTALVADMADRQFEERMARVRRTLDGLG